MNGFMNMGMGYNQPMNMPNDYFSRMNMNMNVNNLPHYDIIKVNGQNGAEAFQMGPNSKALLLDENDPIVWFVQTDGAGYKSNITPYSITPFQPAPPVDLHSLEERLTALEEKINAKSYSGTSKQSKKRSNVQQDGPIEAAIAADQTTNTSITGITKSTNGI